MDFDEHYGRMLCDEPGSAWRIYQGWLEEHPGRFPGDFVVWVRETSGLDLFDLFSEEETQAFANSMSTDDATADALLEGLTAWP